MINDTIQLGDYVKRMSLANVTMDSLVQIARFEFNPHIHATVSFNSNTFSSLRYTGNLSEIDPWLQEELLELNELQFMGKCRL